MASCLFALAIVVGGAVPATATTEPAVTPPGSWCASAPLRNAADYGDAFTGLGHAGLGWVTGDGGLSVRLGPRRVVWLFGDTLVGARTADGALAPGWTMARNTLVEQRDACLRPLVGSAGGAPVSYIATPGADDWVWPSGVFVRDGVIQVMLLRVLSTPGPPGFAFTVTGVAATTLSRDDLAVGPIVDLPALQVALPAGIVTFGESLYVSGGDVYAYGTSQGTTYVARTRVAAFPTGAWRVWDGRRWNPELTRAQPLRVVGTATGPGINLWSGRAPREPRGLLSTIGLTSIEPGPVSRWTATDPQGPWRAAGTVGTTAVSAPTGFAYGPQLVDLPGAGTVLVYSVNDREPGALEADPSRYGLVFAEPTFTKPRARHRTTAKRASG